jgi:hypothetical protein
MIKFENPKLLTWLGFATEVKVIRGHWAGGITVVHLQTKFSTDSQCEKTSKTKRYCEGWEAGLPPTVLVYNCFFSIIIVFLDSQMYPDVSNKL